MDSKNSNSMRKVGKGIWKTLNAFVLTQELGCMLFWCLFFPVCFQTSVLARTNPTAGQKNWAIATTRTGNCTWRHPVPSSVESAQVFPLEESLLCSATSSWGIFTLTSYFLLKSVYSDPLLPLEECLLWPATSTWGVFTLTSYLQLRSVYSNQLLPVEECLLWPATSSWGVPVPLRMQTEST